MYKVAATLAYKPKATSASMWPIFELTYKLFKHKAVDFLEGPLAVSRYISLNEVID